MSEMCILKACVLAIQLTHGGLYSIEDKLPKSAYAYDGVERDISRFYEEENTPFHLGGYMVLSTGTRINFTYNSGVNTRKLDIGKSIYIGVKQYYKLNDDWSVTYGAGVKLNGKIKHSPCLDSYNRKYYCGDLTSWSEFKQPEQREPSYNISVRLKYNF